MASPRAQRFCCAPSRVDALRAFQPRLWNWLCLGSAALGLLGVAGLKALGRQASCRPPEGPPTDAGALWAGSLASNCLGTAGILARSVLWLAVPPGHGTAFPLCVGVLTWVQYWFASHFWALFCYSLEAFLRLRNPTGHRSLAIYYLLCWGVPAIHCLPGIQLLVFPADACCSSPWPLTQVLEVLHYAATYVALTLVFLGSPVLFSKALQTVPALLQRGTGMYTASERSQELQLYRRFIGISVAFAACWTANVLNEILLLLEPEPIWRQETRRLLHLAALTCWIAMAILNPLSGFLLTLAFSARRCSSCAKRMMAVWRSSSKSTMNSTKNVASLPESTSDPAFGFLVDPGMVEASGLLASVDTSTSMDFIFAVAENGSIQPLKKGEALEGASPSGISWAGATEGK
ncbi:G-protein coupled receptor 143-like [Eublepharis macularius]|uniref:G-protein coupled receptor 143-like n=1 Tax=Eublepharis macularius TaxID=481883 RepID=A0AA97K5E8_EUBMA|nr:G-protein coupled receptor 143-like [Eublepharis macularius]